MNISEKLAHWINQADYEDLSITQTAYIKKALKDAIACGVGGFSTEVGASIKRFINENSQGENNTIILGSDLKASARESAFINGILINALDFDDTYEDQGKALCHPGSTLISVALSACSMKQIGGKELITALALGYEISGRIGESIQPTSNTYNNVWGLNHFMVFGAVVVASRLLDLDIETTVNALGMAGVAANVPSAWKWNWDDRQLPLSWLKDMVGWPAESGLRAALLAKAGFKGCWDIFEGEQGFWRMCASDQFLSHKITDQIGEFTRLDKLSFKPYPCCRWIHSSLDAFRSVLYGNQISIDEINSIEVECLSELYNHFNVKMPSFMIDAEFSVPYAIAMIAQNVPVGPKWYDKIIMHNPATQKLASIVTLIASEELDNEYFRNNKIGARVVVKAKSGKTFKDECWHAHGTFDNPILPKEHKEKIFTLVEPVYNARTVMQLHDLIDNIEGSDNIYSQLDCILTQ